MLDDQVYELIRQALKAIFLIGLPMLVATSLAGILVGVVQSATNVHDNASAYAIRLIGLFLVVYALFPTFSRALLTLFELAFH